MQYSNAKIIIFFIKPNALLKNKFTIQGRNKTVSKKLTLFQPFELPPKNAKQYSWSIKKRK